MILVADFCISTSKYAGVTRLFKLWTCELCGKRGHAVVMSTVTQFEPTITESWRLSWTYTVQRVRSGSFLRVVACFPLKSPRKNKTKNFIDPIPLWGTLDCGKFHSSHDWKKY